MLKLKLQYFGHLMRRADSEDPDAGKNWKQEEKGITEDEMVGWHLPTQWTWVWVNSRSWWWTGRPAVLQSMGSQRVGHDWVTELSWNDSLLFLLLLPWNELICLILNKIISNINIGNKMLKNQVPETVLSIMKSELCLCVCVLKNSPTIHVEECRNKYTFKEQ